MAERRLIARNGATESENRIHRTTSPQQYGFRGGLVPGVAVMAYAVPAVVADLGETWLDGGRCRDAAARRPCTTATTSWCDAMLAKMAVRTPAGVSAIGPHRSSGHRSVAVPPTASARSPHRRQAHELEPAHARDTSSRLKRRADRGNFPDRIGDDSTWWVEHDVVHPGWICDANSRYPPPCDSVRGSTSRATSASCPDSARGSRSRPAARSSSSTSARAMASWCSARSARPRTAGDARSAHGDLAAAPSVRDRVGPQHQNSLPSGSAITTQRASGWVTATAAPRATSRCTLGVGVVGSHVDVHAVLHRLRLRLTRWNQRRGSGARQLDQHRRVVRGVVDAHRAGVELGVVVGRASYLEGGGPEPASDAGWRASNTMSARRAIAGVSRRRRSASVAFSVLAGETVLVGIDPVDVRAEHEHCDGDVIGPSPRPQQSTSSAIGTQPP